MKLDWQLDINGLVAVGKHGKYRIERNFHGKHVLSGVGHDGLLMLALPVNGRPFEKQEDARAFADRLDSVRAIEPQISGC